ncbi:MAG: TIGR02757 family protein, partial [Bacteroidota bacterium]|nr:TIGR02757 family protein [Bacteroidota bacterium]
MATTNDKYRTTFEEMHSFLELKSMQYNKSAFIDSDPVSIPHRFSKKEDIEISGFLTAT